MGRRKKENGNGNGRLSLQERDGIILQYCPLVKFMAIRLVSRLPNNVQTDDLFSAGVIGLMDAIEKFDSTQGIQFETYAKIRVRGAMLDEIRAMDWVPRSLRQKGQGLEKACSGLEQKLGRNPTDEEIAREMNLSMEDYFGVLNEVKGISAIPEDIQDVVQEIRNPELRTSEADSQFSYMYSSEIRRLVKEAIKSLSEKEQLVLSLYYYEELTMKEIGAVMGYTESRISQIHTRALLRLRVRLSNSNGAFRLKSADLPDCCIDFSKQVSKVEKLVKEKVVLAEEDQKQEIPPVSFGQKLLSLRKKKGLTQEALARRVGVSARYVSIIETSNMIPSVEVVKKAAKVLGLTCEHKAGFYELAGVSYY